MLMFMEAQACGLAGKPAEGLVVVDRVVDMVSPGTEDAFLIEFYRLRGDLVLAHSPTSLSEAETLYQHGIALAQQQGACMLELRLAMRLCQLWAGTGRSAEGQQALRRVYGRFTEGFDTPDLVEARGLLEKLA
jgi:predicted ATPase